MFVDQITTGGTLEDDIGGKKTRHTSYFFALYQTGSDNKYIFFYIVCPKRAFCC